MKKQAPNAGDRTPLRAREDYVKAIYQLGHAKPVRAADVARHLGITPVSVSKAKRVLERDGFLEPAGSPTSPLVLSDRGFELAIEMIRRHRLLETFLYRALEVPLERLHAEAERIEHVISDDIALRMAKHLDFPTSDPHGHVIPYRNDREPERRFESLGELSPPRAFRVVSLDDRDEDAVRVLAAAAVLPGLEATLLAVEGGFVRLRFDDRDIALTTSHAARVRVVALATPPSVDRDEVGRA